MGMIRLRYKLDMAMLVHLHPTTGIAGINVPHSRFLPVKKASDAARNEQFVQPQEWLVGNEPTANIPHHTPSEAG